MEKGKDGTNRYLDRVRKGWNAQIPRQREERMKQIQKDKEMERIEWIDWKREREEGIDRQIHRQIDIQINRQIDRERKGWNGYELIMT